MGSCMFAGSVGHQQWQPVGALEICLMVVWCHAAGRMPVGEGLLLVISLVAGVIPRGH